MFGLLLAYLMNKRPVSQLDYYLGSGQEAWSNAFKFQEATSALTIQLGSCGFILVQMVLAYVTNVLVKMNMFRTRCMLF